MQEELRWFVPEYYSDFRCKCGACRNSCCSGWDIPVSRDEYYRLIGMDCSPELHRRIQCAFRPAQMPSPEHFQIISPNWRGDCSMHAEDGLCMLHGECGEHALPDVCRMYPRSLKKKGDQCQVSCTNSCEAVVEQLMAIDHPLRFSTEALDLVPRLIEDADASFAALEHRCLEILQDRSRPLNARLFDMIHCINGTQADSPSESRADTLADMVNALAQLTGSAHSLQQFAEDAIDRYAGPDGPAYCAQDMQAFELRFPDWMHVFENLLANHLVYMNYPCIDSRLHNADAAWGLCAVYGTMRICCAAYLREKHTREDFVDVLAGLFRSIEHSSFYYNMKVLIPCPEALLAL